jgi:hypothetical protein
MPRDESREVIMGNLSVYVRVCVCVCVCVCFCHLFCPTSYPLSLMWNSSHSSSDSLVWASNHFVQIKSHWELVPHIIFFLPWAFSHSWVEGSGRRPLILGVCNPEGGEDLDLLGKPSKKLKVKLRNASVCYCWAVWILNGSLDSAQNTPEGSRTKTCLSMVVIHDFVWPFPPPLSKFPYALWLPPW